MNDALSASPVVLLTGLGKPKDGYPRRTYGIDGAPDVEACTTRYAPLAAAATRRALGFEPLERILVFTTEAAWEQEGHGIREEAKDFGLPEPMWKGVPEGRSRADLETVFQTIAENIPRGARLHLDITNALRYLPFAYFGVASLLRATRGVGIERVTYGMELDSERGTVIDLSWLVELGDWSHAAIALGRGDARPFAELLAAARPAGRGDASSRALAPVAPALRRATAFFATGLPIELFGETNPFERGEAVRAALDAHVPIANELWDEAARRFAKILGTAREAGRRPREKSALALDRAFLEHEARVVETLLDAGDLDGASRVAREWIIDRVLERKGGEAARDWLKRCVREPLGESPVTAAAARAERSPAAEPLGVLAARLRDIRNPLAHAGHDATELDVEKLGAELRAIWKKLRALPDEAFDLAPSTGPIAVLTPLGLSRGVVYTLLVNLSTVLAPAGERVEIEEVLIVTSADAEPGAHQAYAKAREALAGSPVRLPNGPRILHVRDPHYGFGRDDLPAFAEAAQALFRCTKLVANCVGGTTAIQAQCTRLLDKARRLGLDIVNVATIDRRPAAEQANDPYGGGELIVI